MPECRLYLITPALALSDIAAFAPRFAEAAEAGGAASALLRLAPGSEGEAKRIAQPLIEIAAKRDVALLIEDIRLAPRIGADGAHVAGAGAELKEAIRSLHPDRIVGVGALRSRDDAMGAGEAGADYVMFGEPRRDGFTPAARDTLDRVGWWAEIFETPCVAYAATLDDAAALAAAGADFIALGDVLWQAGSPAEAARKAAALIAAAAAARTGGHK